MIYLQKLKNLHELVWSHQVLQPGHGGRTSNAIPGGHYFNDQRSRVPSITTTRLIHAKSLRDGLT